MQTFEAFSGALVPDPGDVFRALLADGCVQLDGRDGDWHDRTVDPVKLLAADCGLRVETWGVGGAVLEGVLQQLGRPEGGSYRDLPGVKTPTRAAVERDWGETLELARWRARLPGPDKTGLGVVALPTEQRRWCVERFAGPGPFPTLEELLDVLGVDERSHRPVRVPFRYPPGFQLCVWMQELFRTAWLQRIGLEADFSAVGTVGQECECALVVGGPSRGLERLALPVTERSGPWSSIAEYTAYERALLENGWVAYPRKSWEMVSSTPSVSSEVTSALWFNYRDQVGHFDSKSFGLRYPLWRGVCVREPGPDGKLPAALALAFTGDAAAERELGELARAAWADEPNA